MVNSRASELASQLASKEHKCTVIAHTAMQMVVLCLDRQTSCFFLSVFALACVSLLVQRHEQTGTHSLVDKLKRCGAEGGHTLCSSCNVTVEEFAAGRATNSLQPDSEALVRHLWRKGQENCRAGSRLVVNTFSGQCIGLFFRSKCLK